MFLGIPSASLIYLFLFLRGSEDKKPREQRVNAASEDEGEEKFGKRGPQKKFKWNEEIRSEQGKTWLTHLPVICLILFMEQEA